MIAAVLTSLQGGAAFTWRVAAALTTTGLGLIALGHRLHQGGTRNA